MKLFWDTNLFIYLWEKRTFAREMETLCDHVDRTACEIVTSALTLGEILVRPKRLGHTELARQYAEAFSTIEVVPFGTAGADVFAELRAVNPTLRPRDAIQLASAIQAKADYFLTNDERLARIGSEGSQSILSLRQFVEKLNR